MSLDQFNLTQNTHVGSMALLPVAADDVREDGRIQVPGLADGLTPETYEAIATLYDRIWEARQVLAEYRSAVGASTLPQDDPCALTPLDASKSDSNLFYKREDLTATRAYKVRGAVVGMAQMMELDHCDGFLAASTGNHALGVLKAAELLRPDAVRIVVPKNTAQNKLDKINAKIRHLKTLGVQAGLVFTGETFDEAREWALNQTRGEYYLDPYSDPWVVTGQGTIGLELYHQIQPYLKEGIDEVVIISPLGGGGLLAGTAVGFQLASAWDPLFRGVNVRFLGLRLASPDSTLGDAIRVAAPATCNQTVFEALGIPIFTMDDPDMARGMAAARQDLGVAVEGASGGTLCPVLDHALYQPSPKRLVVCILSGGNVS